MSAQQADDKRRKYDRAFLLSEGKRNLVMELWEVERYGLDSFSDPQYVCIYGMPPAEWYRRGVRLLARTTVEAVRDKLGEMIGRDVESVIQDTAPATTFVVIDPFAGSCNSLFWILGNVRNSKGLGFEMDQTIFDMTKRNISSLDRPIELVHGDYKALLDTRRFPSDHFIIAFLAPPWGDALNESTGLDLRRTKPPVGNIIDDFERIYKDNRILYVTQVHQNIEPLSLENLKKKFDWSDLRIYNINVEGMKHGIVLGLNRWTPPPGVLTH
jgi:hypothetical protein